MKRTPIYSQILAAALILAAFLFPQVSLGQRKLCVAVDNGTGTIDWPAQCPYGNVLDPIRVLSSSGEQILISIEIPPMQMTCRPGTNPPKYDSGVAAVPVAIPAFVKFIRKSKSVTVPADLILSVCNTPRNMPGDDVQVFDTEILSMSLSSRSPGGTTFPTYSVDWIESSAPGGFDGQTTITRLPTGDFTVDSFFDITYRISAEGAAGSDFEGVSIDSTVETRLTQTLHCIDGVPYQPEGSATISQSDGGLVVSNIGSSGLDGVRFSIPGNGINGGVGGCSVRMSSVSLPTEGDEMTFTCYPPPNRGSSGDPTRARLTRTASRMSMTCSSGDMDASEWVVEVWNGDVLQQVAICPDDGVCATGIGDWFIADSFSFGVEREMKESGERSGAPRLRTSLIFTGAAASEVTIPGLSTVVGDRVVCSPKDPKNLHGHIDWIHIKGGIEAEDDWNVESVSLGSGGISGIQGIDDAVLGTRDGHLVVSNIGSSGCDGVSIDLGGGGGGTGLPFRADLSPTKVTENGTGFIMNAVDNSGNSLIQSEYRGAGSQAGPIFVLSPPTMSTCRVTVLNGGVLVGEFDVPLTAGVQTQVCTVGQGVDGFPLLTGCGKRAIGWPWELSCLVNEFDRPIPITPTGGPPMTGDEVQLLLPDASPQSVADLHRIELRATGIPEIEICGMSSGSAPPHPVLSADDILSFSYPGDGSRMSDSVPKYYTTDNGKTICIFSSLTDLEVLSTNGDITTYSANLRWKVDGIDGNAIDRTLIIPGTITVRVTCCIGHQDQLRQISTQITRCNFALPAGDADFAQLRVRGGSDLGFDSPGDVIITKIPECVFIVEEIQKILAEIDISGTQGGGLTGGNIVGASMEQNLHLVKPEILFDGLMHNSLGFGTAVSVTPGGRLQLDNLGSSGCDGVSVDCPNAEGFEVCFDELSPPDFIDGGTLSFEEFGSLPGRPVGGSLGTCVLTKGRIAGTPDVFFDVCYDFSSVSPSSTTIQVYDQDVLVGEFPVPTSDACFQFRGGAVGGLPMLESVGKLPGLSATPCKRIRWWERGLFQVPGQPPVEGDEVRMLAHGVPFESVSRFELRASDEVDHCIFIKEEVGTYFGRQVIFGGGTRASSQDHNTTRSNRTSTVAVGFGDSDNDDDNDGIIRFPTNLDKRAPVNMNTSGVNMGALGSELSVETFGALPGSSSPSPLGHCKMRNSGGDEVEVSCNFSAIGNSQVRLKIYDTGDRAGENPLYCGELVHNSVLADGAPLCYLKYKLDRCFVNSWSMSGDADDRPTEEVAFYYNKIAFSYCERTEVRLLDGGTVHATRIEVMVVDPTMPSDSPADNWVRTRRMKPFLITGISTGPGYPDGLPVESVGSGDTSRNAQDQLVVSNIGSSGLDGVRIDLGNGEGGEIEWEPIDLRDGGTMRTGIVDPCAGIPENCPDGIDSVAVTIDGGNFQVDSFFDVFVELRASPGDSPEIVCFDETGAVTGRSQFNVDSFFDIFVELRAGSVEPVDPTGRGRVTSCGISPPTVIPGSGYIGRGVRVDFEEPMLFVSDDGLTTCQCTHLIVSCCDNDCDIDDSCFLPSILETTFSGIPQATMTDGRVFVFGRAFSGIDGARLDTCERGKLKVSNLGSSGCDGVSMSDPGGGGFDTEMVSLSLSGSPTISTGVTPPPAGGFESLEIIGEGSIDGGPSPLGSVFLPLGSSEPFVELRTNFAVLLGGGGGSLSVNVCHFVNGPAGGGGGSFDIPQAAGPACHIYAGGASVVEVCRVDERDTPAGQEGPGYCVRFSQPVEVTRPGGAQGSGFMGTCVEVRASRTSGTWDTEMISMDLCKAVPDGPHAPSSFIKIEGIVGESQDRAPLNFGDWLAHHFTPEEIDLLEVGGYDSDDDGDDTSVAEEFIRRTDPHQADGRDRTPGTTVRCADGSCRVRYSYQLHPSVEGAEVRLRTTTDLRAWDESPGQMRLVEVNPMPNGNTEFVWESVSPISAERRKFHGHVTILK